MSSEFMLDSFVLDLSFISLLNRSVIDVTLCASDFSFVFLCFLEVLFYSGYVFLLRSINSLLSTLLEKSSFVSQVRRTHTLTRSSSDCV